MAGGGVDQAGAGLERGVAREPEAVVALRVRVRAGEGRRVRRPFQRPQPVARDADPRLLRRDDAGLGQERLGAAGRDDQVFAVARDRDVVQLGVGDDGQVGRQRPGRRRPDDERRALVAQPRIRLADVADDREADVDRRRGVVLVFDLRLGQRGAVDEAPVHRLLVAVDEARRHEPRQLARDRRLVVLGQRQVGIVPVADAAEPLELGAHDVDELQRVLLAALPERDRVQRPGVLAQVLLDLVLDRQAVAVPAGPEHDALAHQQLRAHDDVLQHLVEHGAVVDGAGRVGRPVVQDVLGRLVAQARLQHALVLAFLRPAREPLRLAARQIGAHREFGLGQVEGRLPVHGPRDTTKDSPGNLFAGRAVRIGCPHAKLLPRHRRRRVHRVLDRARAAGAGRPGPHPRQLLFGQAREPGGRGGRHRAHRGRRAGCGGRGARLRRRRGGVPRGGHPVGAALAGGSARPATTSTSPAR